MVPEMQHDVQLEAEYASIDSRVPKCLSRIQLRAISASGLPRQDLIFTKL